MTKAEIEVIQTIFSMIEQQNKFQQTVIEKLEANQFVESIILDILSRLDMNTKKALIKTLEINMGNHDSSVYVDVLEYHLKFLKSDTAMRRAF